MKIRILKEVAQIFYLNKKIMIFFGVNSLWLQNLVYTIIDAQDKKTSHTYHWFVIEWKTLHGTKCICCTVDVLEDDKCLTPHLQWFQCHNIKNLPKLWEDGIEGFLQFCRIKEHILNITIKYMMCLTMNIKAKGLSKRQWIKLAAVDIYPVIEHKISLWHRCGNCSYRWQENNFLTHKGPYYIHTK